MNRSSRVLRSPAAHRVPLQVLWRHPARASVALLAATALAVSGCSSSGSSPASSTPAAAGSGSTAGPTGGSTATGSPIKVMAIGQFNATSFSYPEGPKAMDAAAKTLNATGGINGHPIVVTSCNDQANVNIASQCARKAVSDGDVAVLGSYSQGATQILPILEAAHIAYIGASTEQPADGTSPNSFPLEGLNQVVFGGVGYGATLTGCMKVGLIVENYGTTTPLIGQSIAAGAELGGGTLVKIANTGTNLPDYAPAIASLESAGAKCIATIMPPDQVAGVFRAMRQSADPTIPMINAQDTFSAALLKQLGHTADGMILSSSTYPASDTSNPEIVKMTAAIKKYEPGADLSQFSVQGWGAMLLLEDALRAISGPITAQSVLTAMSGLKNASTNGLYPPYTVTAAGPVPNAPRIFSTKVLILKNTNGTESLVSKGFVNVIKGAS